MNSVKTIAWLLLLSLFSATRAEAQISHNSNIQTEIDKVAGISKDLKELQALGLKKDGEPGLTNCLNWLETRYMEMGYDSITRDSFVHPWSSNYNVNLIIDKKGSDTALPIVVIINHYDTKGGPGINDNGTGVAATLQIARTIASIKTRASVRFIHFAGEEDGLLGSTHYVNNVLDSDSSIRLVINLDQLGGQAGGIDNDKIHCERDESNPEFNNQASWRYTDTLAEIIELYTGLQSFTNKAFSSDYMPFQDKGYVITGLYQFNGWQYSFSHQPGDTLGNVDTIATTEVTRGALAAVLHFTQTPAYINVRNHQMQTVGLYPNPITDYVHLDLPEGEDYEVKVTDCTGRIMQCFNLKNKERRANMNIPSGIYFLTAVGKVSNAHFTGKLIVR